MRRALSLSLVFAASLLGSGCRGRPRSWDVPIEGERPREGGPAILEFDLSNGAPEKSAGGLLSLPSRNTFDTLVAALHQAKARKELKGVFVTFGEASIGWARAHELGDALKAIHDEAKVPIVCHADAWDNTAYAAAARGCTTIAMSKGGELEATGPAATMPYAHELLVDKLHAQVDMLQIGKYKGAEEPLTRDGPSDEFRSSLEGTLSAIRDAYVDALAARDAGDLVGQGPFMADEAVDKKLVDVLLDRKEAREEAQKQAGKAPIDVVFGPGTEGAPKLGLLDVVRLLAQPPSEAANKAHVRLVRLEGEIALEGGGGLLGGSSGIVARHVVARAHELAKDENVKAVVLRIDSPGGSALGSDLAWTALMELRAKKPLVISIGEMAASGGYYLASTGTKIFAEPESIVGSIGVVGGKISFRGTLEMVGIHTFSFGDQRAAELASITEPWSDATRTRVEEGMKAIYQLFLERVATGRKRDESDFTGAVEGRVFGGLKAKELHLIDEIGGLDAALAEAKSEANLEATTPIVTDEAGGGFFQAPPSDDDTLAPLGLSLANAPAEIRAYRDWLFSFLRVTWSEKSPVAAMMPAAIALR